MSGLGVTPPPAGPPFGQPPPPEEPSSDVPVWVIVLAGVLALSLAALAGFMFLRTDAPPKATPADLPKPTFPLRWDKRIAPIAETAASLRGLRFVHPVDVRFLPPAQFEKTLTSDEKPTKSDREEIRHTTELLRALGLIAGNVNLADAFQGATSAGVLAYYSFDDHQITVRGQTITPAVRATLVHELTHVLQDQNFHVGDRFKRLDKLAGKGAIDSAASVLHAIVEGDAERVEHLYRDSLTPRQRHALDVSQQQEGALAGSRLAHIPKVVLTEMSYPYVLGEGLVQTVAQDGGNTSVDALLNRPPTHESALLDPSLFLAHQAGASKVAVPALAPGEKRLDSGELGTLTWYFMLGERLPLTQALAAADGWGGDAYVSLERAGNTCARMSFAGRTPADSTRMYSALQQWTAAGPGSETSVSMTGNLVHLVSCDPGRTADPGADDSQAAMGLVVTRAAFALGLRRSGLPTTTARCIAGKILQTYSVAQLSNPDFGKNDPNVQARVQQLAIGC